MELVESALAGTAGLRGCDDGAYVQETTEAKQATAKETAFMMTDGVSIEKYK